MYNKVRQSGLRGLTLVELLVVITILLIVAGVVLPMAQPALKGRVVREAAQQVQMLLTSAQAKAVANQEYVGVRFGRVPLNDMRSDDPPKWNHVDDIAYQLTEVKFPAPLQFFGTPLSAIPVSYQSGAPLATLRDLVGFPAGTLDAWRTKLEGAMIVLGSHPQLYRINTAPASPAAPVTSPTANVIRVQLEPLGDLCGTTPVEPVEPVYSLFPPATILPVKIYLGLSEPRFTVAGAVDLPVGAYVDLSWSGTGSLIDQVPVAGMPNRARQGKFWDDGTPVTLVFGPDGSLQIVYGAMDTGVGAVQNPIYRKATAMQPNVPPSVCSPFRPKSDVYLLVSGAAKRKDRELVNFRADSGSFWVIVSPKSGAVASTPNLGVNNSNEIPLNPPTSLNYLERWVFEMRSNASKAL